MIRAHTVGLGIVLSLAVQCRIQTYCCHIFPCFIRFHGCKDSANRVKNQIYLSFSEMQPLRRHTLHLQVRESSAGLSRQRYDYFPKYPRIRRDIIYPFVSVSQRTREASGEPSLLELSRAEAVFRAKPIEHVERVKSVNSFTSSFERCALRGTSLKELREADIAQGTHRRPDPLCA